MHYVFAGPSGFFTTVTDQYLCRRDEPGVPFAQCSIPSANPFGKRQGNVFLEEEESESYTIGFVWEITDALSFTFDYWDIDLTNMVADLSITNVLEREADCRLGETEGGTPVDINSLECRDALNRVGRAPIIGGPNDENITTLTVGPVNRATQHTAGIDAHLAYALNTVSAGSWKLDIAYTHTLEDEGAEFEGDPIEDFRDDLQNFNWRSRMRGSLTWNMYDFTTTIFGDYRGSLPNWAETGRTGGSTYWNWTAGYFFTQNQSLSLAVQNVFNSNPKIDKTFNSYPYFLFYNFDPTGREYFLSYTIKFGQN
jgi:outer membrane receptor protein involved in Fe transport